MPSSPQKLKVSGASNYLEMLPENARLPGSAAHNEIEVLSGTDGTAPPDTEGIGIVYADDYVAIVRDRVLFPSGTRGTYLRIFTQPPSDEPAGAIILPFDGRRFILRRMFRHATRSWEYEAPRGLRNPEDVTLEETARRELHEELGLTAQRVEQLGIVYGDSGLLASSSAVFLGWVDSGASNPHPDVSEAFGELVLLELPELMQWISRGEIRDGLTLAALCMAMAHGHFSAPPPV